MIKPQIFKVLVWRKNDSQTYRLDVHHVAAFTSAEAEETIKECDPDHLDGRRFVLTDAYVEHRGDQRTSLYTTRFTNDDAISHQDVLSWIRRSTRDSVQDGETFPAPYREF